MGTRRNSVPAIVTGGRCRPLRGVLFSANTRERRKKRLWEVWVQSSKKKQRKSTTNQLTPNKRSHLARATSFLTSVRRWMTKSRENQRKNQRNQIRKKTRKKTWCRES